MGRGVKMAGKIVSALVGDIWAGLLDLVYPPKCVVCGEMQSKYMCPECQDAIVFIKPPTCSHCGAPKPEPQCAECHGVVFAFDSAQSVGIYDGVLKEAIHQFKYAGHTVMASVLGALLVQHINSRADFLAKIGCIVPMPIHPSRARFRGFNQSELLASEIGRALDLPVLPAALIRTRPTRPQVDLPVDKRHENVDDAFSVTREDVVSGRIVLLIDDVFTTGSTCDSASRALREAGAREVHVLTVARSV